MKITYLLGAGASKNAVPIVRDFSDAMISLSNDLQVLIDKDDSNYQNGSLKFCNDLIKIANKSREYVSLDTYANYLYRHKKDDDGITLNRLKFITSMFLIIWQARQKVDSRVKHFFTKTLLSQDIRPAYVNGKFNIITWNYDLQLALALKELFFSSNSLHEMLSVLGSFPDTLHPRVGEEGIVSVLNVNGIAGLVGDNNANTSEILSYLFGKSLDFIYDEIKPMLSPGSTQYNNFSSYFIFNWEHKPHYDTYIQKAIDILGNSDTIVIIGYSFPDDNSKEFDKKWINQFTKTGSEIIYQDPYPNEDFIHEIKRYRNINFRVKNDTSKYFIPEQLQNQNLT
jgi:hypothetical protein